jgi:hypothetical protein
MEAADITLRDQLRLAEVGVGANQWCKSMPKRGQSNAEAVGIVGIANEISLQQQCPSPAKALTSSLRIATVQVRRKAAVAKSENLEAQVEAKQADNVLII